jgi:hypothetical protein
MAGMVLETLVHSSFNHMMQFLPQKVSMNWNVKALHYTQVDLEEGLCKEEFLYYITCESVTFTDHRKL